MMLINSAEPGRNDEESRWADPGWEPFLPSWGAPEHDVWQTQSPRLPHVMVVAGAVGSAGATTLAIVLGVVLATEARRKVLILDAAPAGGDLAARVFGTVHPPGLSWDTWVGTGGDPTAVESQLAESPWGVVVLGSDTRSSDSGAALAAAMGRVTAAGWLVVMDAGSAAVGSAALAAGIGVDAAVVLTIPQRVGDANRARWFLSGLVSRYGQDVVADAVVAVCEQEGSRPEILSVVTEGLAGKVSATVAVPMDTCLATGTRIDPAAIAEPVREAARVIISASCGVRACW